MKGSSPGLRARLIQLVLFAVIPAFGVIGFTAINQRQHAAEDVEREAASLVRLTVREHANIIRETRLLLVSLSQLSAVRQMTDVLACTRTVVAINRSYPYHTDIGVATPDGNVFCSSRSPPREINIAHHGYFQRALRSRYFEVGEYQTWPGTDEVAINFGNPLVAADGKPRGIAYAALGLDWLEPFISDIVLPLGSVLVVVNGDGVVLTRYPERDKWVGKSIGDISLGAAMLATPGEGTVEMQDADGVSRLYAFAHLHESPRGIVHIAAGIPHTAAFADSEWQFVFNLTLLFVAAVLALVAAWVGSNVFVLRRMNHLTNAAQRLGRGDLSARTGLSHGHDEFGRLAHSFDHMAETLQRVNRALKTLSGGNRAMVRAADEITLLNEMCRVIVEVGGYQMAWIGFAEQDESKTIRPIAESGFVGGLPALARMVAGINWGDREGGRGAVGTAIRTGKPSVQRDFASNPNLAPWHEEAVRRGYGSVVAFPLLIDGLPIGALAIYAPEVDAFDTDELEVLDESAADLAFGIANLRTRIEREHAQATIKHMALFDRLTGLPNHAQFQEQLRQALQRAAANREPVALAMIGLNRLRQINDALGFQHGDLLLKDAGARMRAAVKENILLARMRGDEFALLIGNGSNDRVAEVTREALNTLRPPFSVGELQLDVSAAAGIATFPAHGTEVMQLMRCGDVAMQQAKKTGRDVVFYSTEQDSDSARRLSLAGELRHAIGNGELTLHYQPKIDIPSGRVCGAEALVRWVHPGRGMIRPDEFIGLAEQTGLIKPLTEWVLAETLRQSRQWRDGGLEIPIAINLSARNLHDARLVPTIDQALAAMGARIDWLEIEITEGAMMEDPDAALKTLERLSEKGITLFIDDFGTGYSSLGYLKKLPVDAVKIDKSFVLDMLNSADSATIVRSTIDLAHDLGLKVVAEGVESQSMLDKLTVLGCDVAQGYHFCKPLPPGQFKGWVEGRQRN